jgi:molybdopterin molybdotransferase
MPIDWVQARKTVYDKACQARLDSITVPLGEADGLVLSDPLVPLTDLPAFPTSSVDGWAVRGEGPWRVVGRVLAGGQAPPLTEDGTTMEIATGAMVPRGTTAIVRVEDSTVDGELVSGEPRPAIEWREPGEEAHAGEELFPAGTRITPGLIGLAAACGYDELKVVRPPRISVMICGDELLTSGPPGGGRVRDALGPPLPAYLRRFGAEVVRVIGPIEDTLEAHIGALRRLLDSDVICTTGGTMQGPVDHLHPALESLNAEYVVNTVAVRPGYPMMIAKIPDGPFIAGLPGNPQSAMVALMSLVGPLLAGLTGQSHPELASAILDGPIPGRGDFTHLALVRRHGAHWVPVPHVGSAMLRGLAGSQGFAVIPPHGQGLPGQRVELLEFP